MIDDIHLLQLFLFHGVELRSTGIRILFRQRIDFIIINHHPGEYGGCLASGADRLHGVCSPSLRLTLFGSCYLPDRASQVRCGRGAARRSHRCGADRRISVALDCVVGDDLNEGGR